VTNSARIVIFFAEGLISLLSYQDDFTVVGEAEDAESALELSGQALDALIRRLRGRLAETNCAYEFIVTVRGVGYKFKAQETATRQRGNAATRN